MLIRQRINVVEANLDFEPIRLGNFTGQTALSHTIYSLKELGRSHPPSRKAWTFHKFPFDGTEHLRAPSQRCRANQQLFKTAT